MALKVNPYVLGMLRENCYILFDDEEEPKEGFRQAVIIDPGAQADKLKDVCKNELKVRPVAILLTHGHFDHVMAVDELRKEYGIDAYILDKEVELAADPQKNLSARFESEFVLTGLKTVSDGEKLSYLGHIFKVIATPGHTGGGCCYYIEDSGLLFSGDTLFCESYGKYSFPTGSLKQIVESVAVRLMALPDEVTVFPGHEQPTTIGHERTYNICNVIWKKNKEREEGKA